jgi:hypothetical protein
MGFTLAMLLWGSLAGAVETVPFANFNSPPRLFSCGTVDTTPPPVWTCGPYGPFGERTCRWVDQPTSSRTTCAWEQVGLTGGAVIKTIPECCAPTGTVQVVLSVGDNISLWKGLRVGSQALGLTGRGESFPFTPPLRSAPLAVTAGELTGGGWLVLEKADCGICLHGDAYRVALTDLAPLVGQRIVFFWESDWGPPLPRRDPYITLPNGQPADDTLLEEANGTRWMVFGETGFTGGSRAALDALYGTRRVHYVADGTPARFLKSAPDDGTVLQEEGGTTWMMVAGTRFPVPDDQTLQRVSDGRAPYKLWQGALGRVPRAPVDGSLLREDNGSIWVTFGGARFHVPDPPTLERLYGGTPVVQLWDGALSAIPRTPPDGTFLREERGFTWVTYGEAAFHVPDPPTFDRLFRGRPVGLLWNGAAGGTPTIPVDGTLLREERGPTWVIFGGARLMVPDAATVERLFRGRPIGQLWNGALGQVPGTPVDETLLREDNGFVWAIFGGARFLVPGQPTLGRLYGGKPIHRVWNGAVSAMPTVPVDGTVLREEGGATWVFAGGAKCQAPDPATVQRLYPGTPVGSVWSGALSTISATPADGTVLREENGAVWVVFGGAGFHVPDPATYARLYATRPIHQLWDGVLSTMSAPADGTLLREESGAVWVTIGAARFHVPDPPTLERLFGGRTLGQVWNGAVSGLSLVPREGTRLREESSSTIFEIRSGQKVPLAMPGRVSRVNIVWDGALAQIP